MKHLIIFLNHQGSRLDNPVYRIFVNHPECERNVTLLYPSGKLDERELTHQVTELRHRSQSTDTDVTFHLCAPIHQTGCGEIISSTLLLIRRLYTPTTVERYTTYLYAHLPQLSKVDAVTTKIIWTNLNKIHQTALEYNDCQLLGAAYFYNDVTQTKLSQYLYRVVASNLGPDLLTSQRDDNDGEELLWAPFFGSFNIAGLAYPEELVRQHMQDCYRHLLLDYSRSQGTNVTTELCVELAQSIAAHLPLAPNHITLDELSFLSDSDRSWRSIEQYWKTSICDSSTDDLKDIPRHEWPTKIRSAAQVYYHSKFRGMGVEFYYQTESKKTEDYCDAFFSIVSEQFDAVIRRESYAPEVYRTVLHSLINHLQQCVLKLRQKAEEYPSLISQSEEQLRNLTETWNNHSFIDRMRGKDKKTLSLFQSSLSQYYIDITRLEGVRFAIKLLDEFIPRVAILGDKIERMKKLLDDAHAQTLLSMKESYPKDKMGMFGIEQLDAAIVVLQSKTDHFRAAYNRLLQLFFDKIEISDVEDLIMRIRLYFDETSCEFIDTQIKEGVMPQVLHISAAERIDTLQHAEGGLAGYIERLKAETSIDLNYQSDAPIDDCHIFIAHESPSDQVDININESDISHIELIHIIKGLKLTELNGFSGQRTTLEPSIF